MADATLNGFDNQSVKGGIAMRLTEMVSCSG
jgi:hypothetical protein